MLKFIIDKDIELKLPNNDDAENFYKLIDSSREHLRTWLPWITLTNSVNDVLPFIKRVQDEYASGHGLKAILVYQGKYAGLIGYNNIDLSRKSASIGYWLGESYQSKGIMTKAL